MVGPSSGATEVSAGVAAYVKPLTIVPVPPGVVAVTSTAPAAWAGVVTTADVPPGSTDTSAASTPPKRTCIPARNPLPLSVTVVPPPMGPLSGLTELSTGRTT